MSHTSKIFNDASKKVTGRLRHWMTHHPIVSNSVLCINLWIAGDSIAQYSEFKYLKKHEDDDSHDDEKESKESKESQAPKFRDEWDPNRTIGCAAYGAAVTGPVLAKWYPFLEQVCVRNNIVARYGVWGAPVLKVLADEFIMDPPCIFLFYAYMNVFEGGSLENFQKKIQTQFLPSWFTSLAVWPIILLGTFRYVPIYGHAPLINACNVIWDGFLSHRNTLSKHEEKMKQEQNQAEDQGDDAETKNNAKQEQGQGEKIAMA